MKETGSTRLPAPRDRAGHLPQLQERRSSSRARSRRSGSPRSASRSATRSRRATSSSARSSSSRWRWSSSCRRPRREQWYELLDARSACAGTSRSASGREPPAPAPARRRRALALLERDRATSSTSTRSAGRSSRGSPTAATSTSPQHAECSGEKLEYVDAATGERYVPHVIEPAAGVDRTMLAFLCRRLRRGGDRRRRERTVLRLHPQLAPVKVAVLPLVSKDGHAREGARDLRGPAPRDGRPSTTTAARSASATAARTRSARRSA